MTVLVTGAEGHIGYTLIQRLIEQGRKVRALVYENAPSLQDLPIEKVPGDVRDKDSLRPAFKDVDVVYHLASYISTRTDEWSMCEAVNVQGVRNIVDLCQQYRVQRLVHFSSSEALVEAPHSSPVDENRPLVPTDFFLPYPRSKAMGQRIVLQAMQEGLDAIIIYPSGVIGPNDYRLRAANASLVQFANGQVPLIVPGGYTWVDVRDVVEGTLRAERQAPCGSSYILSGEWVSMYDLARAAATFTGVRAPIVVPTWVAQMSIPLAAWVAQIQGVPALLTKASLYAVNCNPKISHERAARELGYQPRPFAETLNDTLEWLANSGFFKKQRSAHLN